MQTLGVDQKQARKCLVPGQNAIRPMPAGAFREQLDILATEYGLLEEENRQLRAHLSDNDGASQTKGSFCQPQEATASESYSRAASTDATLVMQKPVQVDVELQDLCHMLSPDGVHFAVPEGLLTQESGTDVQVLEASSKPSVAFASEHKPSVAFASEHKTSVAFASETSAFASEHNLDANKLQVPSPDGKPPAMENPWEPMTSNASSTHFDHSVRSQQLEKPKRPRRNSVVLDQEYNRRPIFANAEDMKEKVRQQLTKENYNVMDFYKKTGYAQYIARHSVFESITLLVIGLNAIWIWIDTDYNNKDLLTESHPVFQVTEHFFCLYFFVEIGIRFCAFKVKWQCFKDYWFVFDSFLVIIMVLETWVMTIILVASSSKDASTNLGDTSILRIARLLRLMRMARVARLLRAMPELVILIKGIVAAARSVFFTLVLLMLLMYIFAIAFTQMLLDTPPGKEFFSSVPASMHTLWLRGTLLDEVWEVMDKLVTVSVVYALLLDVFILMAALTVMNMLVGVLCEVVSAVAASEREEINLGFVKAKIERIFTELELDKDKNTMISKEEFVHILHNREAARAIQDLGVDVVGLVDFAEVFFSADDDDEAYSKELSFSEFMEAVVSLRGSNIATVKDIIDLRKVVMDSMNKTDKQVQELLQLVPVPDEQEQVPEVLFHPAQGTDNDSLSFVMDHVINNSNGVGKSRRHYHPGSDVQQHEQLRVTADSDTSPADADEATAADADEFASQEPKSSWQRPPSAKKSMGLPGSLWE